MGTCDLLAMGWPELSQLAGAAFVGATVALVLAALIRRVAGRSAGFGESSERSLRELAREVEERLDAKLDRLERLLHAADGALDGVPASHRRSPQAPAGGPTDAARDGPELASEGALAAADRTRVLALASEGKSPEAIAEEVGLVRGEVDLILRLYGRELARG